jgi:hypothetical protein
VVIKPHQIASKIIQQGLIDLGILQTGGNLSQFYMPVPWLKRYCHYPSPDIIFNANTNIPILGVNFITKQCFFFIFSQIYSQWVFKPHNDISVFHGGRYCEILITNALTGFN